MMNTKHSLFDAMGDKTVYVRPVNVIELPEEMRAEVEGLDQIYAVHNADGQRLALVKDRKLAFFLARQHELAPVNVH